MSPLSVAERRPSAPSVLTHPRPVQPMQPVQSVHNPRQPITRFSTATLPQTAQHQFDLPVTLKPAKAPVDFVPGDDRCVSMYPFPILLLYFLSMCLLN